MATNSILRLQNIFLNQKGYKFLLTSRFTQDCVENLFSQVRMRQKKPTALQFRNLLKSISISQFLNEVTGSSYDPDEREWLINFPTNVKQLKENKKHENSLIKKPSLDSKLIHMSNQSAYDRFDEAEKNAIYHITGMLVHKVAKNGSVCNDCVQTCLASDLMLASFANFTMLKDFTGQALVYVNEETFVYFLKLEIIFREQMSQNANSDVFNKLKTILESIPVTHFKSCHDIKTKLINKFIYFRLKTYEPKKVHKNKYDSRSMAV